MLSDFINCLCNKDLSVLIKKGKVSASDLSNAWLQIYDKYVSIIGDSQFNHIIQLQKEIQLLDFKIDWINLCVSALKIEKSDEVITSLKKAMPVFGKFDIKNGEEYLKDLQRVVNNGKRFVIELKEKEIELKNLLSKDSDEINKDYFDKLIVTVSQFMKFHIDKNKTSVSEFANMIADMKRHNKALEDIYNAK